MLKRVTHSLRARLMAGFILLTVVAWAGASFAAWYQTSKTLNKLFDTQQLLFAKRLSALDLAELEMPQQLPRSKQLLKHHRGKHDDDTLAFAIFNTNGRLLLNDGDSGTGLEYTWQRDGFTDGKAKGDDDLWRLVWLTTDDGKYHIVVGQEWEYREDLAVDIVYSQLMPWLIALPLMLVMLVWLVSIALKPLARLARQLQHRAPDDDSELNTGATPQEIKPLIDALNNLFKRTRNLMDRERRFTSDAAHELRSPLSALKVQAEVARLMQDDDTARERALRQLDAGIERATRLVDQLLTLSRLDSLAGLEDVKNIAMQELLQNAVMNAWHSAQRVGVEISLSVHDASATLRGQPLLLSLLVRNLLDNAVRYSPQGSQVEVVLDKKSFSVTDNGPGVSAAFLPRIGERFVRPPGQEKTGSGLGLSIVLRIAALHGIHMTFSNRDSGGFQASGHW